MSQWALAPSEVCPDSDWDLKHSSIQKVSRIYKKISWAHTSVYNFVNGLEEEMDLKKFLFDFVSEWKIPALHSVVFLHTQSLHQTNKTGPGGPQQQEACHGSWLGWARSAFLFEGDTTHGINKVTGWEKTPQFQSHLELSLDHILSCNRIPCFEDVCDF